MKDASQEPCDIAMRKLKIEKRACDIRELSKTIRFHLNLHGCMVGAEYVG